MKNTKGNIISVQTCPLCGHKQKVLNSTKPKWYCSVCTKFNEVENGRHN